MKVHGLKIKVVGCMHLVCDYPTLVCVLHHSCIKQCVGVTLDIILL